MKRARSLSQLTTYARCGEQYRLERMDKVPRQPAAWLPQGTALHEAIEAWELSERSLDLGSVEGIFLSSYEQGIDELKQKWDYRDWLPDGIKRTTTSIDNRRELGLGHVRWYIHDALAAPWKVWSLPDDSPALEVPFRLDYGEISVVGFIDIVQEWPQAITPGDYKSGKLPVAPQQLGVYADALREVFGEPVTHGYYWSGQINKKTARPKGWTEPIDLTHYTHDYLTRLFTELDAGIAAGVFLPNPGDHCRVCPVQRSCPEMSGTR